MSKRKYMITFEADATPDDAAAMEKYLAQSIANDFGVSCVEDVSVREADAFARLRIYLEQEVPYRLREHIPIDSHLITEDVIGTCVDALCGNSVVLFDYDRIDDFLCTTLKDMGLPINE